MTWDALLSACSHEDPIVLVARQRLRIEVAANHARVATAFIRRKIFSQIRNFFPSWMFTGRTNGFAGREPMITWATIVTLATGAIAYFGSVDPYSLLLGLAELGGVIALFALVCAAEAFN
jgi:hypothetical protein